MEMRIIETLTEKFTPKKELKEDNDEVREVRHEGDEFTVMTATGRPPTPAVVQRRAAARLKNGGPIDTIMDNQRKGSEKRQPDEAEQLTPATENDSASSQQQQQHQQGTEDGK